MPGVTISALRADCDDAGATRSASVPLGVIDVADPSTHSSHFHWVLTDMRPCAVIGNTCRQSRRPYACVLVKVTHHSGLPHVVHAAVGRNEVDTGASFSSFQPFDLGRREPTS